MPDTTLLVRRQKRARITSDRLREVLHYDSATGVFRWRVALAQRTRVGDVVGTRSTKGYLDIQVDGISYRAHRLAWLYIFGEWPSDQIDHRNTVRDDNRISNLRDATNAENAQNRHRASRDNRAGALGVTRSGRRWTASITVRGARHHLGSFDTPEAASAAYLAAKAELHPAWEGAH